MPRLPETLLAGLPTIGDLRQAERSFAEIFRAEPRNAEMAFVLGMLALRDGREEQAVEYSRKAVQLDPSNADFHYGLAAALTRMGRLDDGLVTYQHALHLRPDHTEAALDLGKLMAARGRFEEAIGCFRRVLQHEPGCAEAHAGLGGVHEALGRTDEAASAYREAVRLGPEDPHLLRALGTASTRLGRLDEAASAFEQALRLAPEDAEVANELGIVNARQGRLEAATAAYRAAIRLHPSGPDAHNNLGNALRLQGRYDEAIACFEEALRLRPGYPEARNNLGIALKHKGKHDEAIANYDAALRLRPDYPEAHNNLGIALAERGKLDAAVVCFQQAVRLRPDYVEAIANLGNAFSDQGKLPEAAEAYRQAIRIRPRDPQLHKNLGIALSRMEKLEEAAGALKEALRLRPDYADAHNDLGIIFSRQNRTEEAIASYQEALSSRPAYPEALNNLGNALRNAGRFAESLECYHRAVRLKPTYADAFNNLGIAYAEMGRFDEAVKSYTQCLFLRPTHVDAHLNRALTWLRQGEFSQGWAEYEWRWRKRSHAPRTLIQPQWNGADPAGRRILLITEQGFGDTIQFVRYAKRLKDRGADVILECPKALVKLMGWVPGLDQVIAREDGGPPPEHDVYCPLLSLPGLTGSSVETFPAEVPYIHADPQLVEHWRGELAEIRELKVGINWQGNPGYAGDYHRSVPLVNFEPLARVPGVRLISIQKNHGVEQLQQLAGKFPVLELGSRLDLTNGPFLDTAAVMKNLDLFITSDTAVAHLAGALGVRTWLAVSTTPDWRWLTQREDNPWYPTMRLFRQSEQLVWRPVFERMAVELAAVAREASRGRPIVAEIAPGELLDKISILQIKAERVDDPEKLRHVHAELETLRSVRARSIGESAELAALEGRLREVNEILWKVEDDIRACERDGDFGQRFIELARAVYKTNDTRAAIKKEINLLLGSGLVEEKSYATYGAGAEASPDFA